MKNLNSIFGTALVYNNNNTTTSTVVVVLLIIDLYLSIAIQLRHCWLFSLIYQSSSLQKHVKKNQQDVYYYLLVLYSKCKNGN